MVGHFQIVLEAIADDPDQRLSQSPLLTQAEQDQLLIAWNNTRNDYPMDLCIHQHFEVHVRQNPDDIALVFKDKEFPTAIK